MVDLAAPIAVFIPHSISVFKDFKSTLILGELWIGFFIGLIWHAMLCATWFYLKSQNEVTALA